MLTISDGLFFEVSHYWSLQSPLFIYSLPGLFPFQKKKLLFIFSDPGKLDRTATSLLGLGEVTVTSLSGLGEVTVTPSAPSLLGLGEGWVL